MVWPALLPPWKRTTMSARFDSQSMILPLPSSPHWAPITVTFAIIPYPDYRCSLTLRARARVFGRWSDRRPVIIYSTDGNGDRAKVPHPVEDAAPSRKCLIKHAVIDLDHLTGVLIDQQGVIAIAHPDRAVRRRRQ